MGKVRFSVTVLIACVAITTSNLVYAQVLVRDIPAPSSSSSSLTYDGEAFWSGDNSNRLVRFSLTDGTPLDTVFSPVNGSDGLSFVSNSLWTISGNDNRQQIFKLDPATGTLLDSIPDPARSYSGGMASEGASFWVSQYHPTDKLYRISSIDGALEDSLNAFGDRVRGVAYADGYIWTTSVNADADVIYRVNAETGELDWQFSLPEHASLPDRRTRGLAWVDGYLWIIAIDQATTQNRVLQYDVSNAISPDIVIDSTNHDFGELVVGFPAAWSANVSNIGNVTLRLDSAWFSIGDGYIITNPEDFPVNLVAEASRPITISFDPPSAGTFRDTLWIASNDPDEGVSSIVLNGLAQPDEGNVDVNPISINFGAVWFPNPTLASSRNVQISNSGFGELIIDAVEITSGLSYGIEAPEFPRTLASQETVNVRVWFAPHELGAHNGTLTIGSSDPDQPTVEVNLSGEGVIANHEAGESIWSYGDPSDNSDVGINAVAAISDVNGDDIHDVIACSGSGLTVCLNGSSANQGDTLWTYNSRRDPNHAGMVYYDRALDAIEDITGDGIEDVLIGTAGGSRSVYALSGQTGEELWEFDTRWWGDGGWVNDVEGFVDINGDQVADVLAAGGSDGGSGGPRRVFALDGEAGDLLWEGPAYTSFYALTTVADVNNDNIRDVVGGTTSWVVGINGATGERLWQTSIGANSPVFDLEWMGSANPATNTSEDIAAASAYLGVYAIDGQTGEQLWLHDMSNTFVYELTVLPDMTGDDVREVIIATTSGHVICLDGAEGFEVWNEIADPDDPDNVLCIEAAPDLNDDGIDDLVCGTLSEKLVVLSGWDGEQIFNTFGAGNFDPVDAVAVLPDIDGSNVPEVLMGNRDGWVDCVSAGSVISPVGPTRPLPEAFALMPAYPNPFNPTTTIRFNLALDGYAKLSVFNSLGQLITNLIDGQMLRGEHAVQFSAEHLPSGLYFYRLEAAQYSMTQKMVLLK